MSRSRLLLCSSLVLALAGVAHADDELDPVAAYKDAVARARAAFAEAEYAEARAAFEEAYAIHKEPVLRFNIASTYRREGDLESAIAEYRAFLEQADRNDPNRALAEETIADLEAQLEAEQAPALPVPEPVAVEELVIVDEPEEPAPPPRTRSLPRADELMRVGGLVLGAASVVTLGASLAAARDMNDAEQAIEDLPNGRPWNDEEAALEAEGRSAQRRLIVWSIATVTLAGSGIALYVAGDRRRAALSLTPTGDGGIVTAVGRW